MIKLSDRHRYILAVIFAIGILVMVLPVVLASGYTYLCEDDFSFECGAKDAYLQFGSSFLGAVDRTKNYYNTNQGTYLFTFLIHFIRAFSRGGLTGLHIYMVFDSLLFALSLLNLMRLVIRDKTVWLGTSFATFLMIFGMTRTIQAKELFFWYTGTLNFTLELSMAFIAISFLILFQRKEKKVYLVLSSIFAFLASGGSLNMVAASCAFMLTTIIVFFWEKKFRKQMLIPFGIALLGAVINAAAPGNFIRSTDPLVEGHATFFDALRDTLVMLISEEKFFFGNLVFIIGLCIIFALCTFYKLKFIEGGVSVQRLILVLLGTGAIRYFTLFPVAYGYHTELMSNMRTTASYEIVGKLSYVIFILFLAQFVWEQCEKASADKVKITPVNISLAVALLALIVFVAGSGRVKYEFKDSITYAAINDFRTGAMQETYAARKYVFDSFAAAEKDTDVILYIEPFNMAISLYGMGLTEDSGWFVNQSCAGLFDLNSVTVLYQ